MLHLDGERLRLLRHVGKSLHINLEAVNHVTQLLVLLAKLGFELPVIHIAVNRVDRIPLLRAIVALYRPELQAQILVFCLQPLIVRVDLQQSRNLALLCPLQVELLLLHALEVSHVIELAGRIETSIFAPKFLLELTSIQVVLADLVIDLSEEFVQVVVLILDPGNPAHGQVPLDVGLGQRGVLPQFHESSSLLSSEDVGLSFHDCISLRFVLFPLQKCTEGRLNHHDRFVTAAPLVTVILLLDHVAPGQTLDFHETIGYTLESLPLVVASPCFLDLDGEVLLDERQDEAGVPSAIWIDL